MGKSSWCVALGTSPPQYVIGEYGGVDELGWSFAMRWEINNEISNDISHMHKKSLSLSRARWGWMGACLVFCCRRLWCWEKMRSCKSNGKKRSACTQGRKKNRQIWLRELKKKHKPPPPPKPHQGAKTSVKWGVDKGFKLINKQKGALPCKAWMTKRKNQALESVPYHFHHKSW